MNSSNSLASMYVGLARSRTAEQIAMGNTPNGVRARFDQNGNRIDPRRVRSPQPLTRVPQSHLQRGFNGLPPVSQPNTRVANVARVEMFPSERVTNETSHSRNKTMKLSEVNSVNSSQMGEKGDPSGCATFRHSSESFSPSTTSKPSPASSLSGSSSTKTVTSSSSGYSGSFSSLQFSSSSITHSSTTSIPTTPSGDTQTEQLKLFEGLGTSSPDVNGSDPSTSDPQTQTTSMAALVGMPHVYKHEGNILPICQVWTDTFRGLDGYYYAVRECKNSHKQGPTSKKRMRKRLRSISRPGIPSRLGIGLLFPFWVNQLTNKDMGLRSVNEDYVNLIPHSAVRVGSNFFVQNTLVPKEEVTLMPPRSLGRTFGRDSLVCCDNHRLQLISQWDKVRSAPSCSVFTCNDVRSESTTLCPITSSATQYRIRPIHIGKVIQNRWVCIRPHLRHRKLRKDAVFAQFALPADDGQDNDMMGLRTPQPTRVTIESEIFGNHLILKTPDVFYSLDPVTTPAPNITPGFTPQTAFADPIIRDVSAMPSRTNSLINFYCDNVG